VQFKILVPIAIGIRLQIVVEFHAKSQRNTRRRESLSRNFFASFVFELSVFAWKKAE